MTRSGVHPSKNSHGGDAPLVLRTIGGSRTEVRVQKESTTFVDITSLNGKGRVEGQDYDMATLSRGSISTRRNDGRLAGWCVLDEDLAWS